MGTSDIDSMNEEELKKLKRFLFEERIRLNQEKEKQKEVYNKFMKERLAFQTEMKALNHKVLSERKRLKDEHSFFDKKLQILQNHQKKNCSSSAAPQNGRRRHFRTPYQERSNQAHSRNRET